MSSAWIEPLASALVLALVVALAVRPTLPARRRYLGGGAPLSRLAAAPLAPVPPREFPGGTPSRGLAVAAWVASGVALVLAASAGRGVDAAMGVGLGLALGIVAGTFAFANWFALRVRLRVDGTGLYGRVLWREHGIPWRDVSELRLRYVFIGGGARLVYYCVRSPTREVSFPTSLAGFEDLRRTIEAATGLRWPVPAIVPTL